MKLDVDFPSPPLRNVLLAFRRQQVATLPTNTDKNTARKKRMLMRQGQSTALGSEDILFDAQEHLGLLLPLPDASLMMLPDETKRI